MGFFVHVNFSKKIQNEIALWFFDIFWCDRVCEYKKCLNFTFLKKFWCARTNLRAPPNLENMPFFRILPSFKAILVISGNRQTKIFKNHKIYEQNITNFNFWKFPRARAKNTSIWNFEKSLFFLGRSRLNFSHMCARNIARAPKFFWQTLSMLARAHKIFEVRGTSRAL